MFAVSLLLALLAARWRINNQAKKMLHSKWAANTQLCHTLFQILIKSLSHFACLSGNRKKSMEKFFAAF